MTLPGVEELARAGELLRGGGLVAFPTETVYGLGANALDPAAVRRIFEAKGRPETNPLIVHVGSIEMAKPLVKEWPEAAAKLAARWWPGPLSIVLPKRDHVPDLVTAGLPGVALRMPSHPLALALIRAAGVPLAAPSANRFAQLSPTTADHVRQGMGERVDMILDGGACQVGIESTVLSLMSQPPTLLRPGMVTREQLEKTLSNVQLHTSSEGAQPSPGLHPRHYCPRTSLVLIRGEEDLPQGRGALVGFRQMPAVKFVQMPDDPYEYAAVLYATLHQLDALDLDWIAVERPPDSETWSAIVDRLQRAACRLE
ncbi:MAG: threonylcarbamoyl-AMP synthase [Acidimicrobiia bacterium]|nr:threonylcarbamoyl-AMP synthase [Acidimicrobiia bacterium]